jgi:hypothetical protein
MCPDPIFSGAVPVTLDNFARAESDTYFHATMQEAGGLGRFVHIREPVPVDHQGVVRPNRDTLYSSGIFDLQAGPVTITLPEAGGRFRSMMVLNEDEYVPKVVYGPGAYTLTRQDAGTRYAMIAVRILVDPDNPEDVKRVCALQDAIEVAQEHAGLWEAPSWDPVSQEKVRGALLTLAETMPDSRRCFGKRGEVDPVRHLVGAAAGWGGNPEKDALYLNVVPPQNDGKTVHRFTVGRDAPVDGFWSVSVYNKEGYFEPNPQNVYSLNNMTAKKDPNGSVTVQFGGCKNGAANCLPIMPGWNYTVRLYQPRPEVLSGEWKFPEAKPVG